MAKQSPSVSSYIARATLLAILEPGAALEQVCKKAGLDPAILEDPEARMSAAQFAKLFSLAQEKADRPHPGLSIGRKLAVLYPGGNVLLGIMANCPTIGAALEKFQIYHDIMADAVRPKMEKKEGEVLLSWDMPGDDVSVPRSLSEALLLVFTLILKLLTQGAFVPKEVRFSFPEPKDRTEYEKAFGAPLVFGRKRDELAMDPSWLEAPISMAHPGLGRAMEEFAHQMLLRLHAMTEWTRKVEELVLSRMLRGREFGLAEISSDLAMSERNVQYRLQEENTSYKDILGMVRRQVAEARLAQTRDPVADLAFLLGFSDQSAFNRAFKRWTGQTPREFRKLKQ